MAERFASEIVAIQMLCGQRSLKDANGRRAGLTNEVADRRKSIALIAFHGTPTNRRLPILHCAPARPGLSYYTSSLTPATVQICRRESYILWPRFSKDA